MFVNVAVAFSTQNDSLHRQHQTRGSDFDWHAKPAEQTGCGLVSTAAFSLAWLANWPIETCQWAMDIPAGSVLVCPLSADGVVLEMHLETV